MEVATLNAGVRVQNGTLATLYSKVQSDNSKEQENRILRAKMEEQSKKIGRQCEEMAHLNRCASEKKKEDKILEAKLEKQIGSIERQREALKWQFFLLKLPGHVTAQRSSQKLHHEKRITELSTRREM